MTDHLPGASALRRTGSGTLTSSGSSQARSSAITASGSRVPRRSSNARTYAWAAAGALPAGLEKVTESSGSDDHHRVAVRIEAVAFRHGMAVRRQDKLAAGKGGYQHEQG